MIRRGATRALAVAAALVGLAVLPSSRAGAEEAAIDTLLHAHRVPPTLIAHRGLSARFPENTLAAFRAALDEGAAMIELDVTRSADGAVVVLHDERLERTTDGEGPASALSLDALRRLDAGRWFDARFAGEPIPTLAEALDLVRSRGAAVNVEIKPEAVASEAAGGLEEQVVALVRERAMAGAVVVSSFEPTAVGRVKRMAPEIRGALLLHHEIPFDPVALLALYDADGLHANRRHLTAAVVEQLHAAQRYVCAYTVNDPDELRRLARLGVDGLFTDDVAAARAALAVAAD